LFSSFLIPFYFLLLFFLLYVLIFLHFIIQPLFLFLPRGSSSFSRWRLQKRAVLGISSSGESTHFPDLTHMKLGHTVIYTYKLHNAYGWIQECIWAFVEWRRHIHIP
jgi:hypothetical protein